MAIVIESSATTGWSGVNNGSDLTIGKPTGLAVDDLMMCVLGMIDEDSTNFSCTPPSGWTSFCNVGGEFPTNNGQVAIRGFYKVAVSDDTSATDFSFQNDSGEGVGMSGIIYRISGYGSPSNIQLSSNDITGGGTSLTFTDTLTPAYSNGYLFFAICGIDSSGTHTASAYAITNDNPSWTEDADYATDGSLFGYFGAGNGSSPHFSIAHASRPETSATGDSSVTLSNDTNYVWSVKIFLPPSISASVSPAVMEITTSVPTPTVTGGANITPSVIDLTVSIPTPTVTTPSPKWVNEDKSSASTFTNEGKTA